MGKIKKGRETGHRRGKERGGDQSWKMGRQYWGPESLRGKDEEGRKLWTECYGGISE